MKRLTQRLGEPFEREFLYEILDNIPIMIAVKEALSRRFLFANRAAESLWGLSRDSVIGKTAQEVFPAAQAALIDKYDDAVIDSLGPLILSAHPNLVQSGETKIVASKRLAIRDRGGKPTFLVSVVEDLTKQTKLEEARESDRDFLNQIINNVPSPIVVQDANTGKYVLVNDEAAKYIGRPREELLGKVSKNKTFWESIETIEEIEAQKSDPFAQGGMQSFIERVVATRHKGTRLVTCKRIFIKDRDATPKYTLTVMDDVTDRHVSEERMLRLAHYDSVTNLPNRTLFRERLNLLSQNVNCRQAAVLYLDLDQFKHVNDRLGHSAGDALLKIVADRLTSCVELEDTVSRLGGDEFAIIRVGNSSNDDLVRFIEGIREALIKPILFEGITVSCGASIGVARVPIDGTDCESILKAADLAMYQAKADGRNTYRFFQRHMLARIAGQRAMRDELQYAIENGQLHVQYQPIVRISDRIVTSCEALARWQHPTRGYIPPSEFIPLAESSGLIDEVGSFVLEAACRQAVSWPDEIKVAVNVSPMQLRRGRLQQSILTALTKSGLQSRRLVLEITEATLLEDNDFAFSTIKWFKDLGIQIALDDFGTGFSSLSYLQRFPFDKIKIDRSFVKSVADNVVSRSIVLAITGIAAAMNSETVAEGVETKLQADLLATLGCTKMQGFFISRPLSTAHLSSYLSTRQNSAGIVACPAQKVR